MYIFYYMETIEKYYAKLCSIVKKKISETTKCNKSR